MIVLLTLLTVPLSSAILANPVIDGEKEGSSRPYYCNSSALAARVPETATCVELSINDKAGVTVDEAARLLALSTLASFGAGATAADWIRLTELVQPSRVRRCRLKFYDSIPFEVLSWLARMPALVELEVVFPKLTDLNIAKLGESKTLQTLTLRPSTVNEPLPLHKLTGLSALKQLRVLRILDTEFGEGTQREFGNIIGTQLENLCELEVSGPQIGKDFSAILATMPKLRRLALRAASVHWSPEPNSSLFAALEVLEFESLDGAASEFMTWLIGKCPNLTGVSIAAPDIDSGFFALLGKLKNLNTLSIAGCQLPANFLNSLKSVLPAVRGLEFSNITFSGPSTDVTWGSYSNLQQLALIACNGIEFVFPKSSELPPQIQNLNIDRFAGPAELLARFGTLSQITELSACATDLITIDIFEQFCKRGKLKDVLLDSNRQVDNDWLQLLAVNRCPVRKLSLCETSVAGGAWEAICQMESIVSLNLTLTSVGSAGFEGVKRLRKIQTLSIMHCAKISSTQANVLLGMTQLGVLLVDSTFLQSANLGLSQMQLRLPHTYIFVSNP